MLIYNFNIICICLQPGNVITRSLIRMLCLSSRGPFNVCSQFAGRAKRSDRRFAVSTISCLWRLFRYYLKIDAGKNFLFYSRHSCESLHLIFRFRHFPVITRQSPKAAEAGGCAAEQDRFWQYHNFVYEQTPRGALSISELKGYATIQRPGILEGLLFTYKRIFLFRLCLQYDERKSLFVLQQEVNISILCSLKIIAKCIILLLGDFSI